MIDKYLVAIGGGSLAEKTTALIDGYVANLAKVRTGERRAVGVFIGTASHDSMPYFNTFRKTYTSDFNLKADCVLSVYGEMNEEKIKSKFEKADLIYIGGGDTLFMLDLWREKGIYDLVVDAYNRGVIIAGLSAGAICWFKKMYTDSQFINGKDNYKYSIRDGIGILDGVCCPHYEERVFDFDGEFASLDEELAWGIEGNSCIVFKNGKYLESLSAGGKSYKIVKNNGSIQKILL